MRTINADNVIWTTNDGRALVLSAVENEHLANIIKWVNDHPERYTIKLMQILRTLASERGLSDEFLASAEYPYDSEIKLGLIPSERRISEDNEWTNYEGRKVPLKSLEDTHLANIIAWVNKHSYVYPLELLVVLTEIADKRGLSPEFLAGAEYPYKNEAGEPTVNMAPLSLM
jgi:hypothetical protein